MSVNSPENSNLLEQWRAEKDFSVRETLYKEMEERGIFPSEEQRIWETQSGTYPALEDPDFVLRILSKMEFQESKQKPISESLKEGIDRCRSTEEFELSPVQRFVSRFLNPSTPYRSALLFHGVGVGKTCAAITIAENFLEMYPGRKVYIVAPPNIQSGFERTLFDPEGLTLSKDPSIANRHKGCTGDTYLRLTDNFYEESASTISHNIKRVINKRYKFFGYQSLYNYIRTKLKGAKTETQQRMILREEFSNRLLIIDEAHNLRDLSTEKLEDGLDEPSKNDTEDAVAGKLLTPFLRKVLDSAENLTLVLMTATPMYNSYLEILFLMNLLLLNDKRPELSIEEVFNVKKQTFRSDGKYILGKLASCYISFMRGENPLTFPLRLFPQARTRVKVWPVASPKVEPIEKTEREACTKLPIVAGYLAPETEDEYYTFCNTVVSEEGGLGIANMDRLVQAGNFIFPNVDEDEESSIDARIGKVGFDSVFEKTGTGQFTSLVDPSWLLKENMNMVSGKCALLLERLENCKGVAFVYSRFVSAGALTIALALEANGYKPYGSEETLLEEGNQHPEGGQCALCPLHKKNHKEQEGEDKHAFVQARYVLLTGSPDLSPNNAKMISAARAIGNVNGSEVKVVLGSQIAGEGLDLRFVREVFVYDSWYHLNKLEQIIGRGIRNCSHAALKKEQRNCTITLHVNANMAHKGLETADMYSYRTALSKAQVVGNVTRVLKQYAIDCSLNHDAIVVKDTTPIPLLVDSQGEKRENVPLDDVPFSPLCDWLEECEYDCLVGEGEKVEERLGLFESDSSTYDEYTAKWQMMKLKAYIEDLISKGQAFVSLESLEKHFTTIPKSLLQNLLTEIIEQGTFKIHTARGDGKIVYRNGYYVFQPDAIVDERIPIALRLANFPTPRDRYDPPVEKIGTEEKKQEAAKVVGEKAAKRFAIGAEDSEELWEQAKEWVEDMKTGEAAKDEVPAEILNQAKKLPRVNFNDIRKSLEQVVWIYRSIRKDEATRVSFANLVLEYVWDELLTIDTKREQLFTNYKSLKDTVLRDASWMLDGELIVRFLDTKSSTIEYYCLDEKGILQECSLARKRYAEERKESDPLLLQKITPRSTGQHYGFLAFKAKTESIVFKHNTPPEPGKKLAKGAECQINSQTGNTRKILNICGDALRKAQLNDLGINKETIAERPIISSVSVCSTMNLVFRFMDLKKVEGKRWFYRPLEAKLHGHPGT